MEQRWLFVFLLCCVLISLAWAAPKRNKDKKRDRQGRREQQQQQPDPTAVPSDPDVTGHPIVQETMEEEDTDPKCSPWTWSECRPNDGECGRGVKLGVRVGEECKKTEKEKPCTVRCKGGGGRRKGGMTPLGCSSITHPVCSLPETIQPTGHDYISTTTIPPPTVADVCTQTIMTVEDISKLELKATPKLPGQEIVEAAMQSDERANFYTGLHSKSVLQGKHQQQHQQQPDYQEQETMQEDDPTVPSEGTEMPPTATAEDPPEMDETPEVSPVDMRCSPWSWTLCEPLQGRCGKGFKIGTRGGPGCRGTLKQKACFKPCGDGSGGGNGNGRKGKAQKQNQGPDEDSDPKCTPWSYTQCEPLDGDCGPGVKSGTRSGPECKKTEKQKDCEVPCDGEEPSRGNGGGRKKGKKQKAAQNQRGRPQTPKDEDDDSDPRCSKWSYSDCEPLEGDCGAGIKIGTRAGPKCKKTRKEKDCRVPCGGGGGGGGGKKNGKGQRQKDQPRPYEDDEEEEVEVKGKNGKKRICKYRRGDWSECDEATNTQTRTMVLKKGDEETCPAERYITKPCDRIQRKVERKLDCRYGASDWGLCNITSGMRMRVDILEDKGMEIEGCRTQRIVYKKCALACDYEYTEWSTCDPISNIRKIEGTLVRTEDTPPDCEPTVVKTKPCFGRNGREKCFFGPWSEYSPCINGFKYRIRELVAGGRKCELQASHAAKCKEKEMKE